MKISTSFFIEDEKLSKAYDKVWDKISNVIQKGFDSEPVYNEKYLKTKVKFYNGKINTNFPDNEIPKSGSHWVYLSVILMDSVFKMGKDYYSQVFLKECKYVVKENKRTKFINDNWKFFLMSLILKKEVSHEKYIESKYYDY